MNLRQKNKKLKWELAEARMELASYHARAFRELLKPRYDDIVTLQMYGHRPDYSMMSDEECKVFIVKKMAPELAKYVTWEHYIPRGGVPNADFAVARIRVVKPKE
jgi:hypothetical protein